MEHAQSAASSPAVYSSIVVGTDFTPCSGVALVQALRIASWSAPQKAKVHVVHVIDRVVVQELEAALSKEQPNIRAGLVRDAEKEWQDFAKDVPDAKGLEIEVSVDNDLAGILARARLDAADLIVIGTYGRHAPQVGLGTVASGCVRKSMTDTLLVRDSRPGLGHAPFRRVVAAVDFSPTSLRAVQRAALFAAKDGAELHLLHVFQAPWHKLHYRSPTALTSSLQRQQFREGLENRLTDFCRPALASHGKLDVRSVVFDYTGHRSGIVEYAAEAQADLIVLGTRGRTNLRDLIMGSTAEKALEDSACSILAVKPTGFHDPLAADAEPRELGQ